MVYLVEKTKLFWMLCGAMTAGSLLQACGQISSEAIRQETFPKSKQERVQVMPERIWGEWETECFLDDPSNRRYEKTDLKLVGGGFYERMKAVYEDAQCQRLIWKTSVTGQVRIQLDQITFYPQDAVVLSQSESQTSYLNLGNQPKDRYCEASELFVTNQPKEFKAAACREIETSARLDLYGRRAAERELFVDDLRFRRKR